MPFWLKSFYINKNRRKIISLCVESKYFSRVDLKAFPILRNRGNLYLEQFEFQFQCYKSKKCKRKLYVKLSLILNLCKSSLT